MDRLPKIHRQKIVETTIRSVGGTSTSFGHFSYLCPKKPEGARRSSDLYCPIRKNCELVQKNERECFQVLNMASLARRNLQGDKPTSSHALAVSERSLAVGDSAIYALMLNSG